MNSDYIRFLEEIGKHDTGFAGGKGANLGEIFRARLPVPPAFVVTTKAYEVFSKSHGLEQKIERILSRIDVDDFANLEKGAAEIRRIVESSALPGEVSRVVGLAYEELCRRSSVRNLPVAVRSSATMEDLREANFAGQQITLLNVRGKKAILSAIRKCWASVYTARATFYRVKKGFGSHSIPTAVVVQRQVEPEGGRRLHPSPSYRRQGGHRHRGRVRAGGGCCVGEGYPRYVRHRQEEREINRNPDNSQDLDENHEQIGVGPRDRKGPEISEGEAGPDRR